MPKVMTQEEFLVKATLKHGQYNYSQAKYSGWDSILTIICPLHGSFDALISAGYKVVSIWQSDFGRISI